jgi:molecular chaperone GrpE
MTAPASPPAEAAPGAPGRAGTRAWVWLRWRAERRRAAELQGKLAWLQAELENVRKQAERERAHAGERAAHDLVAKLLPALDSLDSALHGADPADPLAHGLELVRRELAKTLAHEGLQPIPGAGSAYDPLRHEAIARTTRACADGEAPGLFVAEEVRKGYTLRGRVLRPAMVRVEERNAAEPAGAPSPARESHSKERDA